ncbi:hypothetical protein AGDE_00940 [Angomonas deanei]|nr:hypothetical protein AGDE_00940 [Angomonas deanei]|eukprot:EPY42983.1 hypothetical protein AGDE_00940 [Angomonas deanei]
MRLLSCKLSRSLLSLPFFSFFFAEEMKRFAAGPLNAVRGAVLMTPSRFGMLEHKTKGSPYMKHLDIYARRDPQLAPYLLREVDIEYKRKCRKVKFLVWLILFTVSMALQTRMQSEELHYMRLFAELMKKEQDAKDEDNVKRREIFVQYMNLVKDAFFRSQKWTKSDDLSARNAFRS